MFQVAAALQKAEVDRTDAEKELLKNNVDLVEQAAERYYFSSVCHPFRNLLS